MSMENLKSAREICDRYEVPLFLDACRFAENAWMVKLRGPSQQSRPVKDIVREMFDLSDGATISAKKDGIASIGGLLLVRDEDLFRQASDLTILTEGYVTYGGLSGRDLEAMAVGFQEVLDEEYLRYRIRSTEYLGERLLDAGIQIVEPPGGHAIYIDASEFCPHVPVSQYPGHALAIGLYRHYAIRTCEVGCVMCGEDAVLQLVRLCIPRRVYTQSHIDYVVEATIDLHRNRDRVKGLRIVEMPKNLPHFSARFEEVD